MKNSKFLIDKLGKLFEQGIISSKDLTSELFNILKSKRDEIVFKMKIVSKDEFDVLSRRVENLENKIKKLEASNFFILFSKFSTRLDNTSNSSLLTIFILKTISSLLDFKILNSSEVRSFEEIIPCSKSLPSLSIKNLEFFIFKIYIISNI